MLQNFLDTKPLYYDNIDYARMPLIYEKIKVYLSDAKVIHIVGTNGKGTTGRFLATALHSLGYKTAHYTSPHILKFNERIWINGTCISDKELDKYHKELLSVLSDEDASLLSYFEYTTFLAMMAFESCDYIVLEAGLGGEHDATAVFDNILTLVTPIDIDHEFFLGNTIDEIAFTKLNAIKKSAILATQNYDEVYEVAKKISQEKSLKIYNVDEYINKQDYSKIKNIAKELGLASYLINNLSLAISALKFLGMNYAEHNFRDAMLFGRLTKIGKNILLDVGHNTLAASAIATTLCGNKYILVYNSYKDKNYEEILAILSSVIEHVEIINIDDERVVQEESLHATLKNLSLEYSQFKEIADDKNYLVFGSFSVVETFIKKFGGRLKIE